MCGIAGLLRREDRPPIDERRVAAMVERIHHRGPDERGVYCDGDVGLGHARLSIIDLSGGRQPIHNEDSSLWTVFNGEIFNYIELRHDLERRGHRFYTNTDTEVLVHLYEEHGDAFVDELNGQFAIALWDVPRKRLTLVRDRLGIRPLYVADAAGQLCFASEVKALFALPEVERRIDAGGLVELLTYWSALEPHTVFAGVEQLSPGELRVYERGVERARRRYWDWSFPDGDAADHDVDDAHVAEAAAELRDLLVDATRLRLRADVPVGAYLSGGLDSSVITSLVHHYGGVPLRTFSLSFESAEHDERHHQQRLVAHLDTEHSEIRVRTSDIGAAFPRAVEHAEVPMLRTAPTPLLLLSGLVREQGYKVVLTGEGADEVFAGYDIFREAELRRLWLREPDSERARALAERLYPYLEKSPLRSPVFARSFFGQGAEHVDEPFYSHIPRWKTSGRACRFLADDFAAAAAAFEPFDAVRAGLPEAIARWHPLSRAQYIEAHTLMAGYLLSTQGDRVMMANSIEGRFPFLDHRVVEMAARLPPGAKLRASADAGWDEKHVLKRSMDDLLPREIVARPKQPYRAPDSQSFFSGASAQPLDFVEAMFDERRLADAGYFHPGRARKLLEKCRSGRAIGFADNQAFVGVLSTMLVDELIVRKKPSAPSEDS